MKFCSGNFPFSNNWGHRQSTGSWQVVGGMWRGGWSGTVQSQSAASARHRKERAPFYVVCAAALAGGDTLLTSLGKRFILPSCLYWGLTPRTSHTRHKHSTAEIKSDSWGLARWLSGSKGRNPVTQAPCAEFVLRWKERTNFRKSCLLISTHEIRRPIATYIMYSHIYTHNNKNKLARLEWPTS